REASSSAYGHLGKRKDPWCSYTSRFAAGEACPMSESTAPATAVAAPSTGAAASASGVRADAAAPAMYAAPAAMCGGVGGTGVVDPAALGGGTRGRSGS